MKIAELRTKKGLTQSELAELIDTSQSYLSQIEAGRKQPSIKMMRRISEALGCSFSELMNGAELTDDEKELLDLYRKSPAGFKSVIFKILSSL